MLCIILMLVLIGTWLSRRGITPDCIVGTADSPQRIHAIKVVAQPWLGQHHVFGIFMVPSPYLSSRSYSATISVLSFSGPFSLDQRPETQWAGEVVMKPGSYLVRGYVPTRMAVWFLITGQFGELRSPCHWTLEFKERSK